MSDNKLNINFCLRMQRIQGLFHLKIKTCTMKRIFLTLMILITLLTFFPGCSKEDIVIHTPVTYTNTNTNNVTLTKNGTYHFELGYFGDEEGASISMQAIHFSVSKLDRDSTGKIGYTYTPALNYTGTDEVELKSMRGSDGASANNTIIFTKIKFNISN